MKIIGVYKGESGRMQGEPEKAMMIWPDSAMIRSGKPLFIPDDTSYRFFVTLGVKISRLGKSISPRFASRYYSEIAPMALLLPERAAERIREGKHPYATDIVRDCGVVCGDFMPKEIIDTDTELNVYMSDYDNTDRLLYVYDNMELFKAEAEEAICLSSMCNTLKIGDLIIPAIKGYGHQAIPDNKIRATIDNKTLLKFNLK